MTPPSRPGHRLAALAFPPGPRRAELLDTLAESGERLSARETADILWHGARARLGRPKNPLVVPLALLVMVLGAFVGGVASTRVAWAAVPPLPSGDRAAALNDVVFPGLHVYGGGDVPDFVPAPDAEGGPIHGYVTYLAEHTDATRDVAGYTAGARARLTAAGWTVHDLVVIPGVPAEPGFWAERDGLVLEFSARYWPDLPAYDSDGHVAYSLSRAAPEWMRWAALPGAPAGAVVAFLVFGWVSRRTEHGDSPIGLLAMIWVLPLPLVLLFGWEAVRIWWHGPEPGYPPVIPFWQPLVYDFAAGPTYALIFLTLGALLIAAAQRPFPFPVALVARHPRRWLAGAATVLVAAGAGWAAGAIGPCDPDGVPDQPAVAAARDGTTARVYVDPAATEDQRNLIQAAIGRAGGLAEWHGTETRDGPTTLSVGCPVTTPWFDVTWTVPGMVDRLRHQAGDEPGVVAIRAG
ncbi:MULTISPECIES: hypothetical protein [Catenuloplanes]|uniref:Uncharacterized protein n=1 Tax=Catenuloplanes niger TaxID=587534 RepID=A0AAE3ZJB3_9ACTN|nr:hypothetical protein [Catenuloplanes niger]MDR7320974.1 hypothetical protein [Catenuloplanes niger]